MRIIIFRAGRIISSCKVFKSTGMAPVASSLAFRPHHWSGARKRVWILMGSDPNNPRNKCQMSYRLAGVPSPMRRTLNVTSLAVAMAYLEATVRSNLEKPGTCQILLSVGTVSVVQFFIAQKAFPYFYLESSAYRAFGSETPAGKELATAGSRLLWGARRLCSTRGRVSEEQVLPSSPLKFPGRWLAGSPTCSGKWGTVIISEGIILFPLGCLNNINFFCLKIMKGTDSARLAYKPIST